MVKAARCFLEFNCQASELARAQTDELGDLRERHHRRLSSLLEVDREEGGNLIIDRAVMQWFVGQHQADLEVLQTAHSTTFYALERKLQRAFSDVLQAAAWEGTRTAAIAHAPKGDPPSWGFPSLEDGMYYSTNREAADAFRDRVCAFSDSLFILDVSYFARRGDRAGPVPVRAVGLASPPYGPLHGPQPGDSPRPSSFLSPYRQWVVDLSPMSGLAGCLTSLDAHRAAFSPLAEAAAVAHLRRLAFSRYSMLLLITPDPHAVGGILHPEGESRDRPELLLGARSGQEGFAAIPGHSSLKVNFNTRLWGANIVLWEAPPPALPSEANSARNESFAVHQEVSGEKAPCGKASLRPTVVEEALRLAFAWGVDMFSIAVVDDGESEAASISSYGLSMEVLRQVQWGLATLVREPSPTRPPYGAAIGKDPLPRTNRDDPKGAKFATADGNTGKVCTVDKIRVDSGMTNSTPMTKNGNLEGAFIGQPPSASGSLSATNIMFNLPMAIRVFLPIPEKYFLDDAEVDDDHAELNLRAAIDTRRRSRTNALPTHASSESGGGVSSPAAASILPSFFSRHGSKLPEEPNLVPSVRSQSTHTIRPTLKQILYSYLGGSAQLK
ncbi:unnamed protein product [Phytomonas sp. Hart1]|nr:unnamed protein product [Phytomonas sp. Hart1]|eukprot:CCW66557.1 unnamed protein product [Phytomonas sp. isolate Hart1]